MLDVDQTISGPSNERIDVVTGSADTRGRSARSRRAESPEEGQITDSDTSPEREKRRGKKLISGLLTKPDEAGILQVVQYAHQKLDPTHVKDRTFKQLSFHFFVAGELELLLQENLGGDERTARLAFLRTLCYHKEYLDEADLKDQYVANLQAIERGEASWGEVARLNAQLHSNLTFRAAIKSRERENATVAKLEKLVSRDGPAKGEKKGPSKETSAPVGKVIYCSEYNRGNCPFQDHHEGVFNKKTVTKWHICRKCLVQEGHPRRSHPEGDPQCPLMH